MKYVYFVMFDSASHDPNPVMSVWSSESKANEEKDRLNSNPKNNNSYVVKSIELNVPSGSDEIAINW